MLRSTTRLLRLCCPVCGVELQVYVRGLGPVITAEEWLAELDPDDRLHLHVQHDETTLVTPPPPARARTRRLT